MYIYCGEIMDKVIKVLLIICTILFSISFLGGMILEILRYVPFSKDNTFNLLWDIFFYSTYVLAVPLVIGIIYIIKKKK